MRALFRRWTMSLLVSASASGGNDKRRKRFFATKDEGEGGGEEESGLQKAKDSGISGGSGTQSRIESDDEGNTESEKDVG